MENHHILVSDEGETQILEVISKAEDSPTSTTSIQWPFTKPSMTSNAHIPSSSPGTSKTTLRPLDNQQQDSIAQKMLSVQENISESIKEIALSMKRQEEDQKSIALSLKSIAEFLTKK